MFDDVANIYDNSFTHTNIGKFQRESVYDYLERVIVGRDSINILELNCGTGEDAVYFAKNGHKVLATDISLQMVNVTNEKIIENKVEGLAEAKQFNINDINSGKFDEKFDLVFSNFGGLNCLTPKELQQLSSNLTKLLNTGGRFIAVVMPKLCLWENIYFLAKLEWNKILRRNTNKSLPVKIGNDFVNTWYYSPGEFANLFKDNFTRLGSMPVGITIPPSYMEPFFKKRKNSLNKLARLEKKLNRIPILANLSDHFLIDLEII